MADNDNNVSLEVWTVSKTRYVIILWVSKGKTAIRLCSTSSLTKGVKLNMFKKKIRNGKTDKRTGHIRGYTQDEWY